MPSSRTHSLCVLTKKSSDFNRIQELAFARLPQSILTHCPTVAHLRDSAVSTNVEKATLLSYSIGEIVPANLLEKFALAVNVHPASPEFPGRDPHFYAAYAGVSSYGATAHLMTPKVDDGRILDVELERVPKDSSGMDLLHLANRCAFKLIERLFASNFQENPRAQGITWGLQKTKRADLGEACRISLTDSAEEVRRKFLAFQQDAPFKNLYIDLYGLRFRFDDIAPLSTPGG